MHPGCELAVKMHCYATSLFTLSSAIWLLFVHHNSWHQYFIHGSNSQWGSTA